MEPLRTITGILAAVLFLLCGPATVFAQATTETAVITTATQPLFLPEDARPDTDIIQTTAPAVESPAVTIPPNVPPRIEDPATSVAVPVGRGRTARVVTRGLEWLTEVARADDYTEVFSETTETLPYSLIADEQTTLPEASTTWQPSGALSGKIVYLMAGHGWTYNDTNQLWNLQRSPRYDMVEDLGNGDQMHIFAHLVWNAGGTVVPLRPVDYQPEERIIDNSMPQATFYGPWAPSSSTIYHGTPRDRVPYLYAPASLEESAVARFRPYIPVSGDYPVYVWARDGADRVDQLYRVFHAGGVTQVRVNHRLVGKGWVWVGTFGFNQGDSGFVEVSNQVMDPYHADGAHVVVADAVRFGNGRGDVAREGGISSYLREDEGDAYWIARSLGHTADYRLYTSGRTDSSATVSAPPKTVAYMNRETEGRYTDRVLISFHSNASTGRARGALSLFNASPAQRPDHQELLAELTGRQINDDMMAAPPVPGLKWGSRTRHTYNGINFGELRKDYLQNEVCATIVETAFHDNPEDVAFLLDPRARMAMARSTLRGLLKWFDRLEAPRHATETPPLPPGDARLLPGETSGTAVLTWMPPPPDQIVGNPPTDYRVFLSYDGRAFDGGFLSDEATSVVVVAPTTTAPLYARVASVNGAGESTPSDVVAIQLETETLTNDNAEITTQGAPRSVLIVDGMTTLDARLNALYHKNRVDPSRDAGWTIQRVRPRLLNSGEAIVRTAEALVAAGVSFATVPASAIADGLVPLDSYSAVIWLASRENPAETVMTTQSQQRLSDYINGGGKLFISGSHVAEALSGAAPDVNPPAESREFAARTLAANFESRNTSSRALAPGVADDNLFPEITIEAGDAVPTLPDALPTDVVTITEGAEARELLRYRWPADGTAAVANGNVVYFAFPFESIAGEQTRADVMDTVLTMLGLD